MEIEDFHPAPQIVTEGHPRFCLPTNAAAIKARLAGVPYPPLRGDFPTHVGKLRNQVG